MQQVASNDAATEEATLAQLAAYYADAETAPAEEDSLLNAPATDSWEEPLALQDQYSDVSDTSLTDDDMEHLGNPRRDGDDNDDADSLFGDAAFSGDEAEADEEADEDTRDEHDGISYVIHNGLTFPVTPTATPAYGPATAGPPIPINFRPTTSVFPTTPAPVQPVSQSVSRADSPVTTVPATTTTAARQPAEARPPSQKRRLSLMSGASPSSLPAIPTARRAILPARGRLARLGLAQEQAPEPVVAESSRMGAAAGVRAPAAAANAASPDGVPDIPLDPEMVMELAIHEMGLAADAGFEWSAEPYAATVEDSDEGESGSDGKEMADAQAEEDGPDPKGKGKAKANAVPPGTETAAAEESGSDSDGSDGEDPADPKGKGRLKAKLRTRKRLEELRTLAQAALQAQQAALDQIARDHATAVAEAARRQTTRLTPNQILETGEQVPRFLPGAAGAMAEGRAALAGIQAREHAKWVAKVSEDPEDNVLYEDSTESEEE